MSRNAERSPMCCLRVKERFLTARFQTNYLRLTIIQCYAPTNEDTDTKNDNFFLYDRFTIKFTIMNKTPKHAIVIVVGNVNAKVGDNNKWIEQ